MAINSRVAEWSKDYKGPFPPLRLKKKSASQQQKLNIYEPNPERKILRMHEAKLRKPHTH